jgi:hypothetical protein
VDLFCIFDRYSLGVENQNQRLGYAAIDSQNDGALKIANNNSKKSPGKVLHRAFSITKLEEQMKNLKQLAGAVGFCLLLPAASQADVITFNFTGGLVVADQAGNIITNNGSAVTPIAAMLTYDTLSGLGSSGLALTMNSGFWGSGVTFHDISMVQSGSNLITGQVLVDWNNTYNMPLNIEWNATGLFNAINYGLQAGDIISGTNLYRDTNGNGVGDAGEFLTNVYSATPYSDTLQFRQGYSTRQGPAPMAATSKSMGLANTTPFSGVRGYFDIGSGNSMHVLSVTAVPVPAAAWLLGSGLLGLLGAARRRKAS